MGWNDIKEGNHGFSNDVFDTFFTNKNMIEASIEPVVRNAKT